MIVTFEVLDGSGRRRLIEAPDDMNLSLMEVLKASAYPVEAVCGGMALCATCYVEVLEGMERLGEPTTAELDMLDTLPSSGPRSRLACQIRISEDLQDAVLCLRAGE